DHGTAVSPHIDAARDQIAAGSEARPMPEEEMQSAAAGGVGSGAGKAVRALEVDKPCLTLVPWVDVQHSDLRRGACRHADQWTGITTPQLLDDRGIGRRGFEATGTCRLFVSPVGADCKRAAFKL